MTGTFAVRIASCRSGPNPNIHRSLMAIQFGVFDHIEPVPGVDLEQTYRDRLV